MSLVIRLSQKQRGGSTMSASGLGKRSISFASQKAQSGGFMMR